MSRFFAELTIVCIAVALCVEISLILVANGHWVWVPVVISAFSMVGAFLYEIIEDL